MTWSGIAHPIIPSSIIIIIIIIICIGIIALLAHARSYQLWPWPCRSHLAYRTHAQNINVLIRGLHNPHMEAGTLFRFPCGEQKIRTQPKSAVDKYHYGLLQNCPNPFKYHQSTWAWGGGIWHLNHIEVISEVHVVWPRPFNCLGLRGVAARVGSVHLIFSMDPKPNRKGGARPCPKQHHPLPQGPPFSIKCLIKPS